MQPTAPLRSSRDLTLTIAYLGAFFAILMVFLLHPLFSGVFWMKYMQDDFFYYLKVAQNIADGRGSTFGGIARTNGYHPLYELLWVCLSYLGRSPHSILLTLAILIFAAGIATVLLTIHFLRGVQLRLLTSAALSCLAAAYCIRMFYSGMEVILTIPLVLAFLVALLHLEWWTQSFARSVALGLLASLVVLSRLDALILVALVCACLLAQPSVRASVQPINVAGVLIGLQAVTLYFLLNHHWFGTFLPISGMAKQLKRGILPSGGAWHSLNLSQPIYLAVVSPVIVGLLCLPFLWKRLEPNLRAMLLAMLVFPWLFYLVFSMESDWSLWSWYLYPIRLAFVASLALFCIWPPLSTFLQKTPVTLALCAVGMVALLLNPWRIQLPELYDRSIDVVRFADAHPGVYAMGDGAGAVGYLLQQPLVQLEGLMMDRPYLQLLRQAPPLRDLLQQYLVDYSIATYYRAGETNFLVDRSVFDGRCLSALEPALAGSASPKARGQFCEQPIFHTEYLGTHTVIYQVGPGSAPPVAGAPPSGPAQH